MQKLSDDLKKNLKDSIQHKASAYAFLPKGVKVDNTDSAYWIGILKKMRWKCYGFKYFGDENKPQSVQTKQARFLKNIDLFATNVSVRVEKKPLMAVYAQVTCDRSEENEETTEGYKYENMQKRKEDFPYNVDRTWLKNNMDYLSMNNLMHDNPIIYSVSTIAGKNIPACKHCDGSGKMICEDCNGTGWIICEACQGIGEMQYEAGNYANGEVKIKSKTCPHCNV